MSAITASPLAARRPATITAAIALLVLLVFITLIPLPGTGDIPRAVLLVSYGFAALKLAAAAGLWWCRKWAAILGFVIVLLDALLAGPGVFGAPSVALQIDVAIGLLASIAVLVLLALRASRRAYV